jgi:hypothetical protein
VKERYQRRRAASLAPLVLATLRNQLNPLAADPTGTTNLRRHFVQKLSPLFQQLTLVGNKWTEAAPFRRGHTRMTPPFLRHLRI